MFLQSTIPLVLVVTTALNAQIGPPYDYRPTGREVILNTDLTQIVPVGAPPYTVTGGVFWFRNVHIPVGVLVRGTGSRPMIWVVTGTFRVDGNLSVDGSIGGGVNSLGGRPVIPGGRGECTGGDGGRGSPNATGRSYVGAPGYGPMNTPFLGGHGGVLGYQPVSSGSGGGGGVFATAGDPYYRAGDGLLFPQQFGYGGPSSKSPWNPGGAPGTMLFVDGRAENNFFGIGYDLNQRIAIPGELKQLFGGQGGAGGGDYTPSLSTSYLNDERGAGGGAGGGVIIVVALGQISIGANGHISANGGNGGSGIGANSRLGGGGGGGSGGLVILASKTRVQLHAHGETYANQDYDFVLSADGGPSLHGSSSLLGPRKYAPSKSTDWQVASVVLASFRSTRPSGITATGPTRSSMTTSTSSRMEWCCRAARSSATSRGAATPMRPGCWRMTSGRRPTSAAMQATCGRRRSCCRYSEISTFGLPQPIEWSR